MRDDLKISAIIETRIESTRLPGKVLLPINNKPVLQLLIDRISYSKYINQIVIASPDSEYTDLIENEINPNYDDNPPLIFYRGSQEDVFDRVLQAAIKTQTDIIVSITADCPFVDPRQIDYLIYVLVHSLNTLTPIDYASNVVTRTYPDGLDIQVFTLEAFKRLNKMIINPLLRQHTGWNFIGKDSFETYGKDSFSIFKIEAPDELHHPEIAITLDTIEDYLLISKIYRHFHYDVKIPAEDIIKYLLDNLKLLKINEKIRRKEPGEK